MDKFFVLVLLIFFLIMMLFVDAPRSGNELGQMPKSPDDAPNDPWYSLEVLASPVPVLVDFKATWCGPCRMLEVELTKLSKKYGERLKLVSLDVDEHPDLARYFNVGAIPMLMLVVDGKVVDGGVGFADAETLSKMIDGHLQKLPHQSPAPAGS